MNIKPSAAIRKNYNEISTLCKSTKEPIFLTKNGEGDLVFMDLDTFSRRESILRLREQLVTVEEERLKGKKGFSIEEVDRMMTQAIKDFTRE